MARIPLLPNVIAVWADEYTRERTAVPMIFLGIFVGLRFILKMKRPAWWFGGYLFLVLLVVFAEVGQCFLPRRVFDLWDVLWGASGAALGLGGVFFSRRLLLLIWRG